MFRKKKVELKYPQAYKKNIVLLNRTLRITEFKVNWIDCFLHDIKQWDTTVKKLYVKGASLNINELLSLSSAAKLFTKLKKVELLLIRIPANARGTFMSSFFDEFIRKKHLDILRLKVHKDPILKIYMLKKLHVCENLNRLEISASVTERGFNNRRLIRCVSGYNKKILVSLAGKFEIIDVCIGVDFNEHRLSNINKLAVKLTGCCNRMAFLFKRIDRIAGVTGLTMYNPRPLRQSFLALLYTYGKDLNKSMVATKYDFEEDFTLLPLLLPQFNALKINVTVQRQGRNGQNTITIRENALGLTLYALYTKISGYRLGKQKLFVGRHQIYESRTLQESSVMNGTLVDCRVK